ncbi:MAG: HAMP domain-containing histidine kinase [Prolixibacteraceae bacterium]|nr:HAMP domain-containing histidine kinase [Prolixibacteraceae bacterium]MBN2772623.1 HAMP domain-containing histidine kinase [Prolixibacteraceae bacterium]
MNKKVFTGLVILMGISILGIIAVQLVWMNNALKVKNELFERGVSDALNKTVVHLEKLHSVNVVNDMMFNDSSYWMGNNRKRVTLRHFSEDSTSVRNPITIIREKEPGKKSASFEFVIKADNPEKGSMHYEYNTDNNEIICDSDVIIVGRNINPGGKVVFMADTLYGDVDSLFTISLHMIDSLETNLDSISMVAPDFSKKVKIRANQLKSVATQVVTEVVSWDAFYVDHQLIDQILGKALKENNITINYKYGVLRDSLITERSENADSLKLIKSGFKATLYPSNIFEKNLQLSVYFPGQDNFIYKSVNWLLMASFIFSMIILVTFAMSIFYILRQKKISEMKSDFINNMTHEFKTPIATISVAADSITNKKVMENPEQLRYFAGMIKKENTRMNRQVEDILTIARLDKKEFEFKWEPIDVHDLINDAIQGISIQVEKKSGKFETGLKAENPVVTTDKFHCTNLIYNLLDNAIKYSVDAPFIEVFTQNTVKGVIIKIRDHGIGMTKAVQSHIFERFYRQSSGNIHNVKGFGLGLSYVKAVVEANRGKITVQSEPGKGSEFSVFLPFMREE